MYAWTGAGVPSSSAAAVVVVAEAKKERRLFVVEEKDASSSSSSRFRSSLKEDNAAAAVDTEDENIAPVLPESWNVDDTLVDVGRSRNASIGVIFIVLGRNSATTTTATASNTSTDQNELPRDEKEEARTGGSLR